jgi:hypothetical protein
MKGKTMDGYNEMSSADSGRGFDTRVLAACVREMRSIIAEMHHAVVVQVEARDGMVRVSRKLQAMMVRLAESPANPETSPAETASVKIVMGTADSTEAPSARRTLPVIFMN